MTIVNKFNVNKQQVTLDADIIENMSANDVSYDDSTQYNENTVGDKLSELEKEVIFDVSAHNSVTFASLSALLSDENLSTLIPVSVRCGGMSIRFVRSSDNKYIQARCMAKNFTTDVAQWQGVDDEPTAGSENLVKSGGVYDKVLREQNYIPDKKINSAGTIVDSIGTGDFISTKIPLATNDVLYWKYAPDSSFFGYVSVFDESGTLLAIWQGNNGENGERSVKITTPNAAYIIVSFSGADGYEPLVKINNVVVFSGKIEGQGIPKLQQEIDAIEEIIENIDEEPTAGSNNLVESGGVKECVDKTNNKATWTVFRNTYYNSTIFAFSDDISQYAGKWVAVKFSFTHDDVNKEISFRVSNVTPFEGGNKVVINTTLANNEVYLFKMPEVALTCKIDQITGTSDMVMYITTDESVLGKLMFDERNIERAANIYTPEKYKSNFSLGNVSIYSTKWIVQPTLSSYSRIRNNSTFFLNKGDKLITDDGFSFYIGYYKENVYGGIKVPQYTDSENYGGSSEEWLTEYVCTEAGYYKILIKDNTETNYDSVDTIFSHFRIIRYGNNLDLQEKVDSVEGVANDAINDTKGLLGLSVLYNITGFTVIASENYKAVVGYVVPKEIIDSTGQYIYIKVDTKKFSTCVVTFYNNDNGSRTNIGSYDDKALNVWHKIFVPIAPVKLEYMIWLYKYNSDTSITVTDDVTISMSKATYYQAVEEDLYKYNRIIRSGAHRGVSSIAPENTAAAFRLAAKYGCCFVETDIRETSDKKYVMIHDGTINRTARTFDSETDTWVAPSETLNVADLTLAQLKEYDFGVWKSEDYVGEKIMTLDEFLKLCNYLGLHPYIEQKVDAVSVCIDALRRNGLVGKSTILADSINHLTNNTLDRELRYGLLVNANTTDVIISSLVDLKVQGYDVFALIPLSDLVSSEQKYINAKIPLETYTVGYNGYENSNYITGFMTDYGSSIGKIKYERAIGSNRIDF